MPESTEQPKSNLLAKLLQLGVGQVKTELDKLPDYELEVLIADITEFLLVARNVMHEAPERRNAFLTKYGLRDPLEFMEITQHEIPIINGIIRDRIGSDRIKELSNRTLSRLEEN